MKTAMLAMVGVFAASALSGQEAPASRRTWQVSGGLAGGNTTVSLAETGPVAPGKSMGGRVEAGVAVNPWTVVGVDVFWTNVSDAVRLAPAPGGQNAVVSGSLMAKLYPVKNGPFVELGAGYASGELSPSQYSNVSARGFGIRYGGGVDIAASNDEAWSVTLYVAGLLIPQPEARVPQLVTAECGAGMICLDVAPRSGGARSDVYGAPSAMQYVNVLHFGVAVTFAAHSTPAHKP